MKISNQTYVEFARWARTRSKMPGFENFLSFYSVILKLGTKKELVVLENPMFFCFGNFSKFSRENDVMNFVSKFGFANMGYLMLVVERTFHKDLKTEKSSEISLSTQKI